MFEKSEEGKMSSVVDKIKELKDSLGPNKVFEDKATRIAHRMAHSPEILLHKDRTNDFLPDVVVYVEDTDDVVNTVKFANKYKIPLIPQGGKISTEGSQGRKGAIAVSTIRMDKILEFDEENKWVVVEPGIRVDHLGEFLEKRGHCRIEWPLTRSATVGGRIGTDGYNRWTGRWGRSKDTIIAVEMVLPDGNVSVFGEGSNKPLKSALGFNLKDLFIGSRGTLGIATKIWIKTPKLPAVESFGYRAFSSMEDAVKTQIELSTDPLTSAWVWRTTQAPRAFLEQGKIVTGAEPPKEIISLLDFNFFGSSEKMVEMVRKRIDEIAKKYGGFLSDKLPGEEQFGKMRFTNRDIATNVQAAFVGTRPKTGERGGLWTPVDSVIPNSNVPQYLIEMNKSVREFESRYPGLSKHAVYIPGLSINCGINYLFFWESLIVDVPVFSREFSNDYIQFYKDHANMVNRLGGTVSFVHGYAPREIEEELIKLDVGEQGYEVMKKIKKAFDPNNIMNPYVRFTEYEDDPIIRAIHEGR